MCYPVTCPHCGKTTWDGCGQHVDNVRRSVPDGQWCTCTSAAAALSPSQRISALFGR